MLDGDIYAQLYQTHSELSANYAILVFLGTPEKHHFESLE